MNVTRGERIIEIYGEVIEDNEEPYYWGSCGNSIQEGMILIIIPGCVHNVCIECLNAAVNRKKIMKSCDVCNNPLRISFIAKLHNLPEHESTITIYMIMNLIGYFNI